MISEREIFTLEIGDIVLHNNGKSYVVIQPGIRATQRFPVATRTIEISNPVEWDRIVKKHQRGKEPN